MTYKGYNIIVVTPAGRKKYLEILIPLVLGLGVVDEYQLWVNTTNDDDIAYMESVESDKDKVKLVRLPHDMKVNGNSTIGYFFKNCTDPNTIYVRFDDDIVGLDTEDAFLRFLDYRIANPQFFLVYGCILNNAIVSHLLQRSMQLDTKLGTSSYRCMCPVGWGNGEFAKNIHDQIAKANFDLSKFRLGCNWKLHDHERVSINCICWLGHGLQKACGGIVGSDEEVELSTHIPKKNDSMNVIFGGFCCVHFAFYTQREMVDSMLHVYQNQNQNKFTIEGFGDEKEKDDYRLIFLLLCLGVILITFFALRYCF